MAPAPIATQVQETYGQCNEDLIVEGLLEALVLKAGRAMSSIRYLEIGANHPIQTSATYLLYRVHEASGVLVEANPLLVPTLRAVRPRDTVVHTAISATRAPSVTLHIHESNELTSLSREHIARFTTFGGVDHIVDTVEVQNTHILEFLEMYVPEQIDFMSIDIEGLDLEALEAMGPTFRPSIIQCEHEAKVERFSELLGGYGYQLIAMTEVNAIFIRPDRL